MQIVTVSDSRISFGLMTAKLFRQKLAASFFIKSTFKLRPDQSAVSVDDNPVLVTGDIYFDEDDNRSLYYSSDFVPFKPRADLLLNATAHMPGDVRANSLTVGFGVGSYLKRLTVFGQRQWVQGLSGKVPSEAQSFTHMPITYENSFGGASYKSNPIGKGRDTNEMPNIEFPKYLLKKPDENIPPAGYGALHSTWEQRTALVGSYGKNYVKERWPCFPDDFDWGFFNSAPKDQQVKGYARGDETLIFQNLHPQYPEYRSALPGLRARCFLEAISTNEQPGDFHEVSMNLDTVWVDMETEKLVLVWRGLTEVQSPKLKEFSSVFVLAEPLTEPAHDLSYYRKLMLETIAQEEAEFEIKKLPADDTDAKIKKEMAALDAEVAQAEKEFTDLEASSAAEEVKHLQLIREKMGDDEPLLDKVLKQPPANMQLSDIMPQVEALRTERPDLAAQREASLNEAASAEQEMMAMDAEASKFEASMVQEPALTRDIVIARVKAGESLTKADLSELDLSELDLSELDLSGARMKQADLSATNLSGANLKGADLSESILTRANLENAILDDVRLGGADCTDTIFRAVSIEGTDFSGLVLKDADFTNAFGEYADFSGAELTGAVFVGTRLPLSDFDACQLAGADFRDAEIQDADFANVQAPGINLERADITGLRSGDASDFRKANMRFVKAAGSMWEGCVLDKADLSHSLFTGAQFVDASLVAANLDRINAEGIIFEDANLQNAHLNNANFLRASFERANLSNAILQGSNLYESGFIDVVISNTDFRSANLKGTLLV